MTAAATTLMTAMTTDSRRMVLAAIVCLLSAAAFATAVEAAESRQRAAPRAQRLSPLQMKLRGAVRKYVDRVVKKNFGFFPIEDAIYDDSWMTKLLSVDMDRVRRVYDNEYILRAIFIEEVAQDAAVAAEAAEPPPKKSFIVDFTVVRRRDGNWAVTDSAIFSIDGVQLFEYTDAHKRVPLERDDNRTTVFEFGDAGSKKKKEILSGDVHLPPNGKVIKPNSPNKPSIPGDFAPVEDPWGGGAGGEAKYEDPFADDEDANTPQKPPSKGPPTGPVKDGKSSEGGEPPAGDADQSIF